jgi:DNA replication and repair protein RecF
MFLQQISLQHFRSYSKTSFTFDPQTTVIIGPNAAGKSNLIEAIGLIVTGKSFRTSKEKQLLAFGHKFAHITARLQDEENNEDLEVVLSESPTGMLLKKYTVNGVPKRRTAFAGKLPAVLFTPLDLAIVSGQPGDRRRFLDEVLDQTSPQYSTALTTYTKALRQRNALLEFAQKTGRRDQERFVYWDNLLITNAKIISTERESLLAYINLQEKKLFPFTVEYDKSEMSRERLLQYKDAEVAAGMTLVGPQRDDVFIKCFHPVSEELEDVKYFCSRGQQRLVTLELKNAQIFYLKEQLETQPLLLLDDIFSELDSTHIKHVLEMTHENQTIITTTHKEFVDSSMGVPNAVIELTEKSALSAKIS